VPHSQDRHLTLCTDPEVSAVQQEIDPVFLWRDGIFSGVSYHLKRGDVYFVPAWGTGVHADCSLHYEGGFLAEVIGFDERLIARGRS